MLFRQGWRKDPNCDPAYLRRRGPAGAGKASVYPQTGGA